MLTARPHPKAVDYGDASRFVVITPHGLDIAGVHYERGDALPAGALEPRFLRLEYSCHHIETFEHAATDPSLREACAHRGVSLDPPSQAAAATSQDPPPAKDPLDLDALSQPDLVALCKKYNVSAKGGKDELVGRLRSLVA